MTTSNYITFILLGVIGLVFLIDFILNSKKKPLEKSVEKFVEKEKDKKKNWLNLKSFFLVYPISFLFLWIFVFVTISLDGGFSRAFVDIKREFIQYDSFFDPPHIFEYFIFPLWIILGVFHLLWFINSKIDNWILKRKKNISMSLLIISFVKLLLHYFIYTTKISESTSHGGFRYRTLDFSEHLSNLYSQEIDLFIPVIIVFLVVVWFFNDKIKAR